VQFWFAVFAILQFLVCQMALYGTAPAVHMYLDTGTNLLTIVPQMVRAKRWLGVLPQPCQPH